MPTYMIAGCIGGAAGVLVGHPLDTVKVTLQTQVPGQYRGTFHCFKSIFRQEGVAGLFKGLSSPLASLSIINAIVFGVYGNIVRRSNDQHNIETHFIAGCASGIAQSFVSSPTELLKLRMQTQKSSTKQYKSSCDCLKKIIRKGGLRSLYRGILITNLRDTPSFGVYFAYYEYMTRRLSNDGSVTTLSTPQLLLAGGSAGMISWLTNYPLDVIKTTFQANDRHSTYLLAIKHVYYTYGMRGFFTGLSTTLIRAFPSNAATFFAVEWCYRLIQYLDDIIQQQNNLPMGPGQRTIHYLWDTSWCLSEAGNTFTEPMIHASRFM